MKSYKVLIIGCGVVGHNLKKELSGHGLLIDTVDKFKPEETNMTEEKYDIAFVCVDTPMVITESDELCLCDTTEVKNAIIENNADLFVIKSTVLPGTTELMRGATGKRVVFSPEYYGGTQHCNNFHFGFTVVGGDRTYCKKVVQMLQCVYDARHQFRMTDSRTAELVKYMENSYLATKVSFCNQFYQIAEKCEVDYEELRELFVLDERVNPSHTFVYEDKPYWDSHCLNKDVPAIADSMDATFLKGVIDFNNYCMARSKREK